jgi:hypothetical protein
VCVCPLRAPDPDSLTSEEPVVSDDPALPVCP